MRRNRLRRFRLAVHILHITLMTARAKLPLTTVNYYLGERQGFV